MSMYSTVNNLLLILSQVVWSVVQAACRAIERPIKGIEGSLLSKEGSTRAIEEHQRGKAVILNTFVDKEYNRKE